MGEICDDGAVGFRFLGRLATSQLNQSLAGYVIRASFTISIGNLNTINSTTLRPSNVVSLPEINGGLVINYTKG